MSYIRLEGENVLLYGEVKPDDEYEYIYVQGVPHIDVPEYQKLVYKDGHLYVTTDVEALKSDTLNKLLDTFEERIKQTDNEFLAYQKRKELGIKNSKDDDDYNKAMQAYREATEWYRSEKDRVSTMNENDLIEYYQKIIKGEA